jgi:hypothetical protein
VSAGPPGDLVTSRVLATFLSVVSSRPAAELVDLGPAIGANVAFLGERIGCKIHVEDLYAELDRHAQAGTLERFTELLGERFAGFDERIDAVLCWDVFDYLAPAAAGALAGRLVRALRPGGALLAFFGAGALGERGYTRYVIEDETHFRCRASYAGCGRQQVLQNRDIQRLFTGLDLFDSLLLKSGVREVLFKKPDAP